MDKAGLGPVARGMMSERTEEKAHSLPVAKAVTPLKKDAEFLHECGSALAFFGLVGMLVMALKRIAEEAGGKTLTGDDALAVKIFLLMGLFVFIMQMTATGSAIHRLFERASPIPFRERGFRAYITAMFASTGLALMMTAGSLRLLAVLPTWSFLILLPFVAATAAPIVMYARRLRTAEKK